MRRLTLKWKRIKKNAIQGENDFLPDNQCFFEIHKTEDNRYFISLAGRGIENMNHKIIVDCPEFAREFCENYLNDNLTQILRYQAKEISRKYVPSQESASYYENFQKGINRLD